MKKELQFPQFRKYLNEKNYFRFDSWDAFEEIRSLGTKWLLEKHEVKILPDRNLVHDLLENYAGIAIVISAEEYEMVRSKVWNSSR